MKKISIFLITALVLMFFSAGCENRNTATITPVPTITKVFVPTIEITTEPTVITTPTQIPNTSDKDYDYIIQNEKIEILKYKGSVKDIIMPSKIKGYPVTSIGNQAFLKCMALTSITIPDSVTNIGSNAFYLCLSLINVTIPQGVTIIKDGTFFDCISLANINIPNSIISIGKKAFWGCSSLDNIIIPESLKVLGSSAFAWCSSMKNITIPDNIKNIEDEVFLGCSSLIKIKISKNITSISFYAFDECKNLQQIEIDKENNSFSSIEGVLYNKDRTILLKYPEGKTEKNYVIPNGVKFIDNCAFSWCKSLVSVIIPASVTRIGYSAFWGCADMAHATFLGNNPNEVGEGVFNYCNKDFIIYYYKGTTGWDTTNSWNDYPLEAINKK